VPPVGALRNQSTLLTGVPAGTRWSGVDGAPGNGAFCPFSGLITVSSLQRRRFESKRSLTPERLPRG